LDQLNKEQEKEKRGEFKEKKNEDELGRLFLQYSEVQQVAHELQQIQAELKLANELAQKNAAERAG
jgi:hypothetical protein